MYVHTYPVPYIPYFELRLSSFQNSFAMHCLLIPTITVTIMCISSQLLVGVIISQFHGNQHTINNNNNTLLLVDNTLHTILTAHTSVVPMTSYVPDHHHF